MSSSTSSHDDSDLPDIDERLVTPGTRYEMLDGELVYVAPAEGPHAIRHSKALALLEAHAGAEFDVACDLLTRTSRTNDLAPDVSVFLRAPDPQTGGRQLAQLAFEIVSTESLSHAGKKAAELIARGVRRVFAINVERERALEWSSELGTWSLLDASACIADPALATPLPIEALVRATKADDAMARALVAKGNPVIQDVHAQGEQKGFSRGKQEGFVEGKQEGFAEGKQEGFAEGRQAGLVEGKQEGLVEALLSILTSRGIALDGAARARILGERDSTILGRWLARAATCRNASQLLDDA
jgi:Uma2 family endonuclease